jgi:hypothetical protein
MSETREFSVRQFVSIVMSSINNLVSDSLCVVCFM